MKKKFSLFLKFYEFMESSLRRLLSGMSNGHNGRAPLGVIMSYYGWNGKDDSRAASKLLGCINLH